MLATRSPVLRTAPVTRTTRCVVRASAVKPEQEEKSLLTKMALPVASLVAAAMISGAVMPEEALAARSSGRVGGSSGFKSSRAAPSRAAPSTSSTVVNNTYIAPPVMAPPMFSPFGGFGFGGFHIMPTFVMPVPFLGGFLQFFLLITLVSVIFNVVRSVGANSSGSKRKDDTWGDL